MRNWVYVLFLLPFIFGCNGKNKSEKDSSKYMAETQKKDFHYSTDVIWLHPDFNQSSLLQDSLLEAFGHSYPVRIFKDSSGKIWLNGWENLIDFNIDPDCGDKFFEYLVPLDTALNNMTGDKDSYYRYFSMNDFFKKSGKKFIIKEVNHRNAPAGIVFEHKNVNLYFVGNLKERNVILTQVFITDAFDKEIEITSILYNLTNRPISEYNGTITITETTGLKDTTIVQKVKLGPINLLTKEIPPYSVQMVKKKIPNKVKSRETKFRYFTDNWESISYKYSGDTTTQKLNY